MICTVNYPRCNTIIVLLVIGLKINKFKQKRISFGGNRQFDCNRYRRFLYYPRCNINNAFFSFQALRLTNTARKESASGEIVNLMAIDTAHIQSMINFLWAVWSTPLQIGFSLYFLYGTVGPSVFAGFGVLVLLFLLNGLIMTQVHKLQGLQMKQKDCRIKLLTEVLNGIKVDIRFIV